MRKEQIFVICTALYLWQLCKSIVQRYAMRMSCEVAHVSGRLYAKAPRTMSLPMILPLAVDGLLP